MATATTQRRRPAVPATPSLTATVVKPATCSVRPPDPRLELSLRAFRQILPKKKRSLHDFQSGDLARTSVSAPAASPAQLPPVRIAAPPATAGPAAPELYDPASPWGVCGIKYDAASPRRPPKNALPVPEPCDILVSDQPVPAPVPASVPTSVPASVPASAPASVLASPAVLPNGTQPHPPWQNGAGSGPLVIGAGLREILDSIRTAPPPHHRTHLKDDRRSANGGYLTDKRFVLANGQAEDRVAAKTDEPSDHKPPSTPATPNGRTSQKAPKKTLPAKPTPPASSPALRGPIARCCPVEVPSILHMILDKTGGKLDPRMVDQYSEHMKSLCSEHLAKYLRLKASMPQWPVPSSSPSTPDPVAPKAAVNTLTQQNGDGAQIAQQPASARPLIAAPTHVPQQIQHPRPVQKKRKVSSDAHRAQRLPHIVGRYDIRPVANVIRDNMYRKQILEEIQERFAKLQGFETTHGGVTNRVIHNLLSVAKQPNAYPDKGPVDVHFLTGDEARAMLDAGSPNEPVVTEKEQTFKWQPRLRPIAELFGRMENLDRRVSVQVPSRHCTDDSFESRDLTQVRDRFMANEETDDPWNILDLRSPLPAAVLPQFLTNENCQLLPRLRDEVLNPSRAERDTATREQWNEWRDVLEWVLLSQGGHNTSPHTDSHGLATWITVQEGLFGYGWMSHPTPEEREAWTANPHGFTGGRWCYLILEPGQTVFFNSGTVHFVFRLRNEHTLALGGHVLQWSGIERWLQIVAAQMRNPHITNEDMEWSAPKYVRVVAKLVEMRLHNKRVDGMGGEDAVRRLLALLKEFDETYIKERPKPKSKKKKQR